MIAGTPMYMRAKVRTVYSIPETQAKGLNRYPTVARSAR